MLFFGQPDRKWLTSVERDVKKEKSSGKGGGKMRSDKEKVREEGDCRKREVDESIASEQRWKPETVE